MRIKRRIELWIVPILIADIFKTNSGFREKVLLQILLSPGPRDIPVAAQVLYNVHKALGALP